MELDRFLKDKTSKAKVKVEQLSALVVDGQITLAELIDYATSASDTEKATCIEAIEFATRRQSTVASVLLLTFVTESLSSEAPRVQWESAKVVGNIAHLFPSKLSKTADRLLENAKNGGTVVRWATAFALGEILKLRTNLNARLLPIVERICDQESDTSIRKKYVDAIKKSTSSAQRGRRGCHL
jgi:hypothetical protein